MIDYSHMREKHSSFMIVHQVVKQFPRNGLRERREYLSPTAMVRCRLASFSVVHHRLGSTMATTSMSTRRLRSLLPLWMDTRSSSLQTIGFKTHFQMIASEPNATSTEARQIDVNKVKMERGTKSCTSFVDLLSESIT